MVVLCILPMLTREKYSLDGFYDELIQADHQPRPHSLSLAQRLQELSPDELMKKQQACERAMFKMGVTFDFHDKQQSIIPFDIVPRTIPSTEWNIIEKGLVQRIKALNLFIEDMYHEQNILKS